MKQTTKGTGISMKLLIALTVGIIFTSPAPAQAQRHCHKHHCPQTHVARHHAKRLVPAVVEVENTSPAPARFQAYGNTTIGDCTFAAAANYEIAIGDTPPAEAQLITEFHAAGGSDTGGITAEAWAGYWKSNGIGGYRMTTTAHPPTWARTMNQPAIANMQLHTGEAFNGSIIGSGGWHMVLVLSASEAGVTVVSSGAEYTMPWTEWNTDVQTVYTMEGE